MKFKKIFLILLIVTLAFFGYKIAKKNLIIRDIENYNRFFWNEYYAKNDVKKSYKFIIVGPESTPNGRIVSDETLILRIMRAGMKLGWQVKYYDILTGKEDEIIKFNPDFIISTIPKFNMASAKPLPFKIYSFIPLADSFMFRERKNKLSIKYSYNGVYPQILTISDGLILTDKKFLLFKELFEQVSKVKFHGIIGYPGVDTFEYDESVVPAKIIYYGINWDKRRASYYNLYDNLAKKGIANYYGPFIGWINNYRNGWKGFVTLRCEVDENKQPIIEQNDIMINLIKEHGIVLILHSDVHLEADLPSLREFEAAAASSIIISDELPFVKNTFGDNALYIETKDRTESEIEAQIMKHYEWIRANPEKVKMMTKKAHEIYLKNFTLEKLLIDIAHMHESVIKNETVDDKKLLNRLYVKKHVERASIVPPSINAAY